VGASSSSSEEALLAAAAGDGGGVRRVAPAGGVSAGMAAGPELSVGGVLPDLPPSGQLEKQLRSLER
jgi:hypothetical protein